MKNYWLNKNDEKNKEIQEKLKICFNDYWNFNTVFAANSSTCWRTPVVEELPKGDKTPVMQIKVCPSTGVKHNFCSVSPNKVDEECKTNHKIKLMNDAMFLPYGVSLIESAYKTNHKIKLMNDAMFMHSISEVLKEKQDSSDIGK